MVEAVKSRDEFIAVAAHELRNPLNVILLTGQLLDQALADPAGLPKVRVLVEKLRVQRRRLNALVERLFDVSRIRAGKFELLKERFDLCGLIREVVARFLDQFSSVRICLDERMVIEGSWDRVRIDQALTNLVSNAIKYGKQKPITISAFVQDHRAAQRRATSFTQSKNEPGRTFLDGTANYVLDDLDKPVVIRPVVEHQARQRFVRIKAQRSV